MEHPVRIHALMSMMSAVTGCIKPKLQYFIYIYGFSSILFSHFTIPYFYLIPLAVFFPDLLCDARQREREIYRRTHTCNTTLTEYMKYISNELKVLDNPKPHNARNVDSDVAMPYSFPFPFLMLLVSHTYEWMCLCVFVCLVLNLSIC